MQTQYPDRYLFPLGPTLQPGAFRLEPLIRSLFVLPLLALCSCASIHATTTQYLGAPKPPPTDPAQVQILYSPPTRAYDRLGQVMVDASIDPAPPVADVEQKMRQEAAHIGADAAFIVYDRVQPVGVWVTGGYWSSTASTINARRLIALALKYRQ